jgi:hypothetical protein
VRWPLGTAALWLSRRHRASAGTGGTRPLWPGPGWPKAAAWATLSGHQGAAEAGRSLAPRRRRLHFAGLRRRCAGGWVKELWVDAWAAASQGTLPCLGLLVSRPCCGQKPHMRGQAMRISAGAGAPERLRLQAPPLCHAAHISFRSSHLPSAAGCVLPGEQGHAGEQRRGDVWSVCVEHVVADGRGCTARRRRCRRSSGHEHREENERAEQQQHNERRHQQRAAPALATRRPLGLGLALPAHVAWPLAA